METALHGHGGRRLNPILRTHQICSTTLPGITAARADAQAHANAKPATKPTQPRRRHTLARSRATARAARKAQALATLA